MSKFLFRNKDIISKYNIKLRNLIKCMYMISLLNFYGCHAYNIRKIEASAHFSYNFIKFYTKILKIRLKVFLEATGCLAVQLDILHVLGAHRSKKT